MAAAAPETDTSGGEMTVLRIKRKRTADPLDALFVHKKKKVEGNSEHESWFRYSGTVNETQIESTKHTVRNFQTIYQQVVHPQASASKDKAKRRERCRGDQKLSRYRIVAGRRPHVENAGKLPLLEENEIDRMYRIFDVVAEDDRIESALNKHTESIEESILCNNMKMIREKLHVSDNIYQEEEDEYVYDLYLAPGGAMVMNDNEIINVEEYYKDDDTLTYSNAANTEDNVEDEDDENDEMNWRNEYPEDEDYYNSSEDKSKGSGESSEDGDYVYSRYQEGNNQLQFDPYAPNVQEEYYCTVDDDDAGDET